MRHVTQAATLLGASLRATGVLIAAIALLGAAPGAALARDVSTSSDGSTAMIAPIGPGSHETPAQLPGSADRPLLTRTGGSGGTRGATKGGTKAGTKAATAAGATTAGTAHNTGTTTNAGAQQQNATTAGTDHATGTNTTTTEGAGAAQVVTPAANANANVNANQAANAGAGNAANATENAAANANANAAANAAPESAVAGFQSAPVTSTSGAQVGAKAGAQLGVQTAPQTGAQAGAQMGPQGQNAQQGVGVLGLQQLPSTSTAAALPSGTIALLSLGGALYAVRRKFRK